MDVIAAYESVGTYRGAAEICGTTHKTVRRMVEAHRAELAGASPVERKERSHNYDPVAELVAQQVKETTGGSRRSGCCRRRGSPAMPGRAGTSAGWSRRRRRRGVGIITGAAGPGCGHRVRR